MRNTAVGRRAKPALGLSDRLERAICRLDPIQQDRLAVEAVLDIIERRKLAAKRSSIVTMLGMILADLQRQERAAEKEYADAKLLASN